jgi:hypothetical protein
MSNLATIVNNILADSGIDDINVVVTTGSYANPPWITSLAWSKITGSPLGDYLPLAGGTMTGNINWAQTDRGITWAFNTDGASIKFYNTGDGDTDSRLEFATLDNGNEYFRWVHIPSGAGSAYESMRLAPNSNGSAQLIVSGNIGIDAAPLDNKLYINAGSGVAGLNKGITIKTANGTYATGDGGMLQFQNEDVITAGIRGVRGSGWGSSLIFYVHNTVTGNTFGTSIVPVLTLNESLNAIFQGTITATSIIRSGGTSSQYLMADGSVSTFPNLYIGTTQVQTSALSQQLNGITSVVFVAQSSDTASIGTTISGTQTFFDFNLSDDNNNDEWRWRFSPSGASTYSAMRLIPVNDTSSNLIVSGTITGSSIIKSGGTSSQYLMADGSISTLTNPITGTGTPNTLPRFTASTTIGDSAVTDNGTTIVLGRATSTLATATEANEITITQPAIELDKPVKLLNFNWYSEPWSIGNIRSSSSPSNGLGIFATSVEKVRFQTNAVVLQQGVNLEFRDNPFIRWSSNSLKLKNVDSSIPVIELRANGNNTQAPRLDIYNAADNAQTIVLNGSGGTGVFNSSLTAVDYRFNTDGYITYDTINSGTATFQIRKFGTNVLSFNASNQASFVSNVILSGKLGVATGNPRTRAEFVSGLPTAIPTFTDTTNGIAVTDGGAIYGRIGVSDFSAISGGYPTYIQGGDYTAAIYYNLLLNPLGANVGIGLTNPLYKLDVNGTGRFSGALTVNNTITSNLSGTGTLNLGFTSLSSRIAGRITGVESPSYGATGKIGFSVTTWGAGTDYGLTEVMAIDVRSADNRNPTIWMNPFGGSVGIGNTNPITRFTLGNYLGNRLPYINGTGNTFDAQGITVTSNNSGNTAIGGGLDLTNNTYSVGAISPVISFSSRSLNGSFNNNYAAIYGIFTGDGGEANWSSGHLVFSTTESYGAKERVRITNIGNMGIGRTDPVSRLEVSSESEGTAFTGITVSNWALSQARAGIAFKGYDWVQSAIWHGRGISGNLGGALVFGTNPDTANLTVGGVVGRMWIFNNGNTSVGSETDNGGKFQVNGNVNVSNGSVFAGLGGPAANRGFYAGSSGFQASFLYNNSTGNLDISPRAGYNTIFTEGDVTTYGSLFVISGKNASARFYGEVGFDGSNRFYITNNAYIYGRNNLVLTGRLDAGNDGYSFGTNCRNSLVFNVNEGGAQGSTGTEYMSIQLQLVTKALYIQSADNSANGRQGTTFFQSGNVSFGSTSDAGVKLDVNGNGRFSGALTLNNDLLISRTDGSWTFRNNTPNLLELHIRPNAGKSAYISFTENAVADKWSIGTTAGDNNFYFRVPYAGSTSVFTLTQAGAATFNSSVTATSFFESSDARLKSNIVDLDIDVSSILAKSYLKNGVEEIGYLAQDVESILPSAISKRDDGYIDLSYRQVHTAKIAALEKEVAELKQQLKNK